MTIHRMTHAERVALGASRRQQLSRQQHATWPLTGAASGRKHDPLALLTESARGRLPELVSLKYRLMAVSPFGYYRGAVPVMAADLALLPHTGILNQICGDAHVRNLGAYEAPDGRLVFDINDFDETTHAPFEWDLKRMAASLVLAGRESGTKDSGCREAVVEFSCAYAELMQCLSGQPVLEVARFQVKRLNHSGPIVPVLEKARRSTPAKTLMSLTRRAVPGDALLESVPAEEEVRVFKQIPSAMEGAPATLDRVSPDDARAVLASVAGYRKTLLPERRHFLDQYRAIDVGFKIVGTGSVGLRDYVVYLEGNGPADPLFLQVKEEARSGWAPFVEMLEGYVSGASHEGQRVADGQRAMQLQSDPFLGWTTIEDRPYLVRQLSDHKASIAVEDLHGAGLGAYARICGELLARGHARAGDAAVLEGYIGKGRSLGEALADFGVRYADQTERDWKALVRSGLGSAPVEDGAGKVVRIAASGTGKSGGGKSAGKKAVHKKSAGKKSPGKGSGKVAGKKKK